MNLWGGGTTPLLLTFVSYIHGLLNIIKTCSQFAEQQQQFLHWKHSFLVKTNQTKISILRKAIHTGELPPLHIMNMHMNRQYCGFFQPLKATQTQMRGNTLDLHRHHHLHASCLPTCLPFYLSICLPAYLSTCIPVYLSTCLFAYLSTHLTVSLSTCLTA